MTLNREVFLRDPLSIPKIPNDGVTTVGLPTSDAEWDVLRYELNSFVCKGEYERGLERILSSYLANLSEDRQPAVWVSGFYGSGKSHLVRVLEALWRDYQFPQGDTARGIVHDLPESIDADLRELTTQGKRGGGLWSAAGTLGAGAGGSFRLAFLQVVFAAAGLPTSYAPARFVLWLQKEGHYDEFVQRLAAEGRDEDEFTEFLVSPVVAKTLIQLVPDFASDVKSARALLKDQFPTKPDISDDEMLDSLADVLELQARANGAKASKGPSRFPCTLLVLDELQQFIGDDNQRLTAVQSIVEAVTQKFGSRVLFVATGQSALQASPILAKFQDRFTVRVQLSDVDVETVVREVVLQKKPDRQGEVEAVLDDVAGEISKHLLGTEIQPVGADQADLVADYPLLPTRRRFWARAMRAIDRGTAGQLRSQLRVTFDAVRQVGDDPLGHVVPADALFDQKRTEMINHGVLLREVDELVQSQHDGTPDGELRARLLATIFLISRLPADLGIRATVDTLADLMVTDLDAGSAELRSRIPGVLDPLVNGPVMLLDGEYRLQTKESAEWNQAYQQRVTALGADDAKVALDRVQELREAVERSLRGATVLQGASKTARKLALHYGDAPPDTSGPDIPIWICDGWSVTESQLVGAVQAAGPESPLVAVHLPRHDADQLKRRLVEYHAASETIDTRPIPATEEGREARRSIESIRADARQKLDAQVRELLEAATVRKGGGAEVSGTSLRDRVESAARDAADRLYPRFSEADATGWSTVMKRASSGAGDALSAVGYTGDVEKHPVCARVLGYVGGGKKGNEVRKHFEAPEFGWPRDAVDGALLALVASGHLVASENTVAKSVKELTATKIGPTDFRAETVTLTAQQRIELRKLVQEVTGAHVVAGEEPEGVARMLEQLKQAADRAGGDPPAPAPPGTEHVVALQQQVGNDRLLGVWSERERLGSDFAAWSKRQQLIAQRLPAWQRLLRLRDHAVELPVSAAVGPQIEAIRGERLLIQEPDPVPPLATALVEALRSALLDAHTALATAYADARTTLESSPTWDRLDTSQREQILAAHRLEAPAAPAVGDPDSLLAALDAAPLSTWPDRVAAVSVRANEALVAAAKLLEPRVRPVSLPSRTLRTEDEVESYVAEVRSLLIGEVGDGPVVVR